MFAAELCQQRVVEAPNGTNSSPSVRVTELTKLAYQAFFEHRCKEGKNYLEQAVDVYARNATSKENSKMYRQFEDISRRLIKCGFANDAKEILLRIIKARMVDGFPNTYSISSNFIASPIFGGHVRAPVQPFEDFRNFLGQDNSKELLALAKASNIPSNVVFVLKAIGSTRYAWHSVPIENFDSSCLAEIEVWTAKENSPVLLFGSMLATAKAYIQEGKFDQAVEKWKSALALVQQSIVDDNEKNSERRADRRLNRNWETPVAVKRTLESSEVAAALTLLGPLFEHVGRLSDAQDIYLTSYKLAPNADSRTQSIGINVECLAKNFRSAGDKDAGAKLIGKFLELAKEHNGVNSFQWRRWQIKLANYYATGGEKELAKRACAELMASIDKESTNVSKQTRDAMVEHAYILKANGFDSEAELVERKVAELEKYDHDMAIKAVQEIQQSHIDGNVPANEDFRRLLVRDLQKYFSGLLEHRVHVKYELFRDTPTQSGIAFPKYYAWVKIYRNGEKLIEQGDVRIAAENKTDFEITDFWNIKKIHDDEKYLEHTFPKDLCPLILEKAKTTTN
ncbi:MAG: hypothetical protein HYX67_13610 [Candidatus Melainabacteria bacterium]|nr:hypothetical protein [Candidatus Melainabacteria bacterium]